MSQVELFGGRKPIVRAEFGFSGKLMVDNFCGGGGATMGIESAIGRPCDIAINHSPLAIAMHEANHPETKHYTTNIMKVDPADVAGGRTIGAAWFSPDCTHHSKARGSKPKEKGIRDMAWIIERWALRTNMEMFFLENVEEFEEWGPLDDEGQPIKDRAGETFQAFCNRMRELGYELEWRRLVAADYGAPTIRRRLFMVGKKLSANIAWPTATHGPDASHPYRTAAEVIDWSIPVRSIFARSRELAPNTLKRIAMGVQRYVLEAEQPFIVRHGHYSTRTGAGMVEGKGAGIWRGQPLTKPHSTICATNDRHLVVPILTKHYGGMVGHEVTKPLGSITMRDSQAWTAAFLTKHLGREEAARAGALVRCESGDVDRSDEVAAFLLKYRSSKRSTQGVAEPLHTLTSKAGFALVEVRGVPYRVADIGMRMLAARELFNAQGFPNDYLIDPAYRGKRITKKEQNELVGNSVCPPAAEALVRAQLTCP